MKVSRSDTKLTFPFFFNMKWSIYTRGWVKLTGSPSPLCPPSRNVPGTSDLSPVCSPWVKLNHPPIHTQHGALARRRHRTGSWRNCWKEICHPTKCCLIISHLVVFHEEQGFSFQMLNVSLQHQPECLRDREKRTLTALLDAVIVHKAGESHPLCALTVFKPLFSQQRWFWSL